MFYLKRTDMETLDYNRLLLVSLWQYNHHGDEGLTPALFEETFGKVYGSHCYENGPATSIRISGT